MPSENRRSIEMDLGWQELVIIMVVVMFVFGAGRLPEVARSLGQGVKEFKREAGSPEGFLGTAPSSSVSRQDRADDI
jgi:sec-independent protein translocase protein TatA